MEVQLFIFNQNAFGRIYSKDRIFLYRFMWKLKNCENTVLDYKKRSKHAINIIFEKFRSWFYGSSNLYFLFFNENVFGRIYSEDRIFLYRFMWKLKNYENTILDYKRRSKHTINIIFEEFRSWFHGSCNLYFLLLMRMALEGSTVKSSFFL